MKEGKPASYDPVAEHFAKVILLDLRRKEAGSFPSKDKLDEGRARFLANVPSGMAVFEKILHEVFPEASKQVVAEGKFLYGSPVVADSKSLRQIFRERFPLASDFEAFCLDNFRELHSKFTNGMDRTQMESMLLQSVPEDKLAKILGAGPAESTQSPPPLSAIGAAPAPQSTPARQVTSSVLSSAAQPAGTDSSLPPVQLAQMTADGPTRGRGKGIALAIVGAFTLVAAIVAVSRPNVPLVPASPQCEIAAPKTVHAAGAQKVAGALKGVAAGAPATGGLSAEAQGVVDRTFDEVPERDAVCQMILQASVCLEQANKPQAAAEMRQYITTKCSNAPPASVGLDGAKSTTPPSANAIHPSDAVHRLRPKHPNASAVPDSLHTIKCEPSRMEFARGHCGVQQCHPGWVRGSVQLAPDGRVTADVQLETDDLLRGPCGFLTWEIRDASGSWISSGRTERQCVGGKSPGKARIDDLDPVESTIDVAKAKRAASIVVLAKCVD